MKRIASEITNIKKYIFHLENWQQRKEGRKQRSLGLHDTSVLGIHPQETQVKDCRIVRTRSACFLLSTSENFLENRN